MNKIKKFAEDFYIKENCSSSITVIAKKYSHRKVGGNKFVFILGALHRGEHRKF